MLTLFDYQQKALDLILQAFKTRIAVLAVMASGLGKTVLAASWAKREVGKKRKGLFLCHENGILDQAIVEFRKVLGEKYSLKTFYGKENGDSRDWRADEADVVFASFQTLSNRRSPWKEVFFKDEFDFIIVDESHHAQAPTYKKVINHFKPKKLLGITATPDRMDAKDIRDIFGEEAVSFSLEESIGKGWLTQIEYHILNDNLNHWKFKKIVRDVLESGERISVKQLNESIFIKRRDEEIAEIIKSYAGSNKKTVVFCENIEHAENFRQFLPDALTYHSKVSSDDKENRKRLDAFREGALQYILAVDKFNEGIDIPDAEVIVFLRCTDSRTIFYQQLGRGLRKAFGKEKVVVLDFVANCDRLAMVKEMAFRVKEFAGNHFILSKELLHVSGSAFDFIFSDEQVDILNLIKRINEPFYETWQEASESVKLLGIKKIGEYWKGYKADPKLHCLPNKFYSDFPGWDIFFGRDLLYSTWQEASGAAKKLGFKGSEDYMKTCKSLDSKLPSNPQHYYKDFPNWHTFLGKSKVNPYPTLEEASIAAITLGIKSETIYQKRYKNDPKLISHPERKYKDFSGWKKFLGKE